MAVNNIQFTKIEIQIVKYIFKHYSNKYNARQLARMLDLNHAHVNKLCNSLLEKNLLIKEEIGNAIYYTFNYKDELAVKFIVYLLSMEEKDIPKWLIVPLHNLKKFTPFIDMGLIFGSSVHTKDFNDIDILLVYDSKKSKEIKKIKDEIRKSGLIEKPIRYMDITENDILLNKDDKVFYNVMSDNILFHNPEKYVKAVIKCRK
tara:strand:+ start:4347 stop:4955 length:609 start_codon:yes stop_codon:yes gene_type:complete